VQADDHNHPLEKDTMNTISATRTIRGRVARRAIHGLILAGTVLLVGACGMMMSRMHGSVERPAEAEFGFGPRTSGSGAYRATLDPVQPIRMGRMQTMRLQLSNGSGQPLDGATVTVDGGMPQHGHGLPTSPRVTRNAGGGVYEVEGMKFNMGGWWVVKFRIDSAAGTDSVVFNLDL
jgi:hypothetical protein